MLNFTNQINKLPFIISQHQESLETRSLSTKSRIIFIKQVHHLSLALVTFNNDIIK